MNASCPRPRFDPLTYRHPRTTREAFTDGLDALECVHRDPPMDPQDRIVVIACVVVLLVCLAGGLLS